MVKRLSLLISKTGFRALGLKLTTLRPSIDPQSVRVSLLCAVASVITMVKKKKKGKEPLREEN